MSNTDLILLLGIGLLATSLAIILPGHPKTTWAPMVLGIAGAVLGALALLTVVLR